MGRKSVLERNVSALQSMPVGRLLWKYYLPAFVGVTVGALYNIIDRMFIGQMVGPLALAGLSAIFPIMLIQMGFGMLLGIGGSVRTSMALGRKDYFSAERLLGHSFALMVVVGLFITLFGFLAKEPMLRLFGVSEQTYQYAGEYLDIILLGSPLSIVGYSLNNFIRSEGNARIAMQSLLLSAVVNVSLDALFIMVFGWGVAGAAWATFISLAVLAGWVLWHFRSRRSVMRLRWRHIGFSWSITWSIVTVGFSPFAMQIAASIVQSTYNVQLVRYGSDYAMSVIGIINSVAHLLVMAIVALNQSAQPIYGYAKGSEQWHRVRTCFHYCIVASLLIATAGFLLVQCMPGTIIRLFDAHDAELLAMGRKGMRIFFALFPLVGLQVVSAGYFQSVGKAGISALLSLLRQVIFLIPLLLLLPRWLALPGVWLATPISDAISGAICLYFVIRELRLLNRLVADNEPGYGAPAAPVSV